MNNAQDKRTEWLDKRKKIIGASEVAAILGADPRRGAIAVYSAKILDDYEPDNKWLNWGRAVEGAIASAYSYETKRPVHDLGATEISMHPDIPYLGATLDRITSIDNELWIPLELKAVNAYKMTANQWCTDPPLHYQIQLQMQMACTGAQSGTLCALIGGIDLAYIDIDRNDGFLDLALPRLEEFWYKVQNAIPPDIDDNPYNLDLVKRLWRVESGDTVKLSDGCLALINEMEKIKAEKREKEKVIKNIEAKIRAEMKEATYGELSDGTMITLKTISRKGYVVEPSEYRQLRIVRSK